MKTPRVLLLVPDGPGIRNFILGPFLQLASHSGDVAVLHPLPKDLLSHYAHATDGRVQWYPLLSHRDRPLTFLLRNCLSYAQMHWVNTPLMQRNLRRPVPGSWRTKSAVAAARFIGRLAASPRGIRALDRVHLGAVNSSPEVTHYRRLLEEVRPSVLFCSHQRPVEVLAPILAARSLGIPTVTFIFSWDNLSSKGRIAAPFDHYFVWNETMRREMREYYPDVPPEKVHIVGTPQFDPYGEEHLRWSREEFCQRIGAVPTRPILCFSGGDAYNATDDPGHVRALMERVRSGQIHGNPQVLLRPCPTDDGCRYQDVLCEYPEILYAPARWIHTQSGNWASVLPTAEDVQFMANLTRHADLNVNFASTMTLDFAIHDKPVVNVAFDVSDPPAQGMPMRDFVRLCLHYRPVLELGAARLAESADQLAQHINDYLADPSLDRDGRRRFVDLEVGVPIGHSSRTILDLLQEIAG